MLVVNAVNLNKIEPIVLEYHMFKITLIYYANLSKLSSSYYANEAPSPISINKYM